MSFSRFKNATQFGYAGLSTQVEQGLIFWLDWAFLGIGGFDNVSVNQSGAYGGNNSRLWPSNDRYLGSRAWQAYRSNWIWESGIEYNYQPNQVTGVYINNVFIPSGFYVDYPNGRIVFDQARPTTDVIKASFSYRRVKVTAIEEPWFNEVMFNSYRSDTLNLMLGSGVYSQAGRYRVQLPAVAVEAVSRNSTGYELGNASQKHNQKVTFYVMAENKWDRDNLVDIISDNNHKTIHLLNINSMLAESGYPLDYRGEISPYAQTYPHLNDSFFWKNAFFKDLRVDQRSYSAGLYIGVVVGQLEIIY